MMDDAWYNAFVPSSTQKEDVPQQRRRSTLLQQPNVSLEVSYWYALALIAIVGCQED